MAGLSDAPFIEALAVPAVCALIAFLSYFTQYVFHADPDLLPGPPSRAETIIFNGLLLCLWISYFRAVTVDPGRYVFDDQPVLDVSDSSRWCKKCQAPKPARAHHCRHCRRCIPKMDHHCPWTRNCVSMTTFPHFLRFLLYANLSLWTLGYFLWQRFLALWHARHMPSHLGPSLFGLVGLSASALTWSVTSLLLGLMLFGTLKSWALNRTSIEELEQDRHEANFRNGGAARDWWDLTGPDGERLQLEHVEFPYDVGFFANMAQAMGTSNVLLWFFPLAGNPRVSKTRTGPGWTWEENGFNRKEGMWPPVNPEKLRRSQREMGVSRRDYERELEDYGLSTEEQVEAFKRRQEEDFRRRKRNLMAELEEAEVCRLMGDRASDDEGSMFGWTHAGGDSLADYGVDENAEEEDEDVPLAELLRRRRGNGIYLDE
ncbi:zf-DHHC domain-containing protein [Trichoderma aethiopicum]